MDFDEEFDELAPIAYKVAYRILGSRGEAEEVAQEAMARLFVRWHSVADHAAAWVSRVAANLSIGIIRKRRPAAVTTASPVDEANVTVERLRLQGLLLTLPRRQREVLVLRYLVDLPEAEVARELGCSVGTVKQHAHRAVAAMRVLLDPPMTTSEAVPDV